MANKKCLVFETMNNINSTMHIVESANPKEVRLTGVFGVAGVKNNNNRIYDKQNYGMMVESLQKVIANEGCLGELEHPNSMNINLNNVSHKIESIAMNEDGTVTGTIVLLDTDKGRNAKAIIEGGVPLYISSRAAGSIDESGHVTLTSLKTYDLVGTPGFSQAKLNLSENQTFESLNESCCIIYESDDDLLGDDDSKEDKSDKKEKDSKEDKSKEDKKEEDSKEDKKEEDSKEEKSDKKENNKNKEDNNITMKDVKDSIDQLAEKIESLEADLHVAKESLSEKDKLIQDLTDRLDEMSNVKINYDAIQEWVESEFGTQLQSNIEESIEDKINEATENIAEGIQNWVCEEFAPEVQNWVCEEFAPEVQNWITEEFAPEVQDWITEEFAPEVQNWITEEYSPELQGWITEEFAPEVQNWITEEFAPVIDGWITEEYAPEQNKQILENLKGEKLSTIDNLLEAIEGKQTTDAALEILKESKTEDKYKGIYAVENMPSEYMPQWTMVSEAKREEIIRRSRMYDFTKQGVLESFWSSVNFNEEVTPIVETKIENPYHANIFARMKSLRKNY